MAERKRKVMPKILRTWWSETYTKLGEKVTLNASTADAANQTLRFQVYEFRRRSKIIKEINVPVHHPEVHAKWKVAYKPEAAEYGNPEFRFKATIRKNYRTSKTLYVPAELEIALTFDDGPALPRNNEPTITDKFLRILSKEKIKVTFFVEHSRITNTYGKNILRKMVKEDHEIGIHGVDPLHHHVKHQDTLDFKSKLRKMKELIGSIIDNDPRFIRPPGGWGKWEKGIYLNKDQIRRIYQELNMVRYNGKGTGGVNSWGAEVGHSEFWPRIIEKIIGASKGNPQKLVILAHDLRDYDANNFSSIIKKIRTRAGEMKVRIKFVLMSEISKGWKHK